eukprot:TRINITY_DN1939_c0_g1_i2.p1 TRINITY_DN1939_c0_g1~~TRINITY_DN1939_c0_g1_i2.p1  ORF type:complete len:206 (+),score=62.17 TRINITY_DN1939_c0_g1_i2:444-1061(+)
MEAAIERRKDAKSIRLSQDAFNRVSFSIYASLGFEVKDTICILHGLPAPSAFSEEELKGIRVRSYDPKDFSACVALCRRVYDVSREMDLASCESTTIVAERVKADGDEATEIVGYTTEFSYHGHSVATDLSVIKALIREGGERKKKEAEEGPGLFVFVRCRLYPELLKWGLNEAKLRTWGLSTLMVKGDHYQDPSGGITLPSIMF